MYICMCVCIYIYISLRTAENEKYNNYNNSSRTVSEPVFSAWTGTISPFITSLETVL